MMLEPTVESEVTLTWLKSSYSSNDGPACVEVASMSGGQVYVRDSKDPQGPRLAFAPDAWAAFVAYASAL